MPAGGTPGLGPVRQDKPTRGADPGLVELVRMIAGEGTVDERCHRILEVFRPWWGFPEPDDPE